MRKRRKTLPSSIGRGKKKRQRYVNVCFDYFSLLYANICGVLILCFDARVHITLLSPSRQRGARLDLMLMNVPLTDSPVANITTMEAAVA